MLDYNHVFGFSFLDVECGSSGGDDVEQNNNSLYQENLEPNEHNLT